MYKNSEGYSDPTAGEAMRRFNKRKRKKEAEDAMRKGKMRSMKQIKPNGR